MIVDASWRTEFNLFQGETVTLGGARDGVRECLADGVRGLLRVGAATYSEVPATDEDVVSERDLIGNLCLPAAMALHLYDEAPMGLSMQQATAGSIIGAAFTEASFGGAMGKTVQIADMIMMFVDDRFGGYFSPAPSSGVVASLFEDRGDEATFALNDLTVVRLTGFVRSVSRVISEMVEPLRAPALSFG